MGKTGLVASFVVLGIVGFGIWGAFFYPPIEETDLPISTPSNTAFDVEKIATEMHYQVNLERGNAGLSALSYNPELAAIGTAHSIDMSQEGFFDHVNPAGEDHTARAMAAGHNCPVGENLAEFVGLSGYNDLTFARTTVQDWMNSAEHRANILDERFQSEGFGISVSGGQAYVTQMLSFC